MEPEQVLIRMKARELPQGQGKHPPEEETPKQAS